MHPQHRIEKVSRPEDASIPLELEPETPRIATRAPIVPASPPIASKPASRQSGPECPKCGYSIVGLKSDVCPECGGSITFNVLRGADRKKEARKQLRHEYRRAAITLVMSFGAVALLTALYGEFGVFWLSLIKYAIFVPIGLASYFLCCMLWIGFDQPWGITTLRLAAIYAVLDAIAVAISSVSVALVSWLLLSFVHITLLSKWLELDTQDAVLVSMVTMGMRMLAFIALFGVLFGN